MKVKVPNYKFSHNLTKGSAQNREQLSDKLNLIFFNEIIPLYSDTSKVPLREIERKYRAKIPEHKPITIKKILGKEGDNYTGILYTIFSKITNEFKATGYALKIKANNNLLSIEDLPTFMHESAHLLDRLLQPKYMASDKKIMNSNFNFSVAEFYEDYYYSPYYRLFYRTGFFAKKEALMWIKHKTKKLLKNYRNEDKLKILNCIKHNLLLEKHAYQQTEKYNKLIASKLPKNTYITNVENIKDYLFDEKINLLNKLIYKVIHEERAKNSINIAKTTSEKIKGYINLIKAELL